MARRFYFHWALLRSMSGLPPRILRSRSLQQAVALHSGPATPKALSGNTGLFEAAADYARVRSNLGAALAGTRALRRSHREYQAALKQGPKLLAFGLNLALAFYKEGPDRGRGAGIGVPGMRSSGPTKWFCCSRIAGSGRERTPSHGLCWRRSTSQHSRRPNLLSLICWMALLLLIW